jgi:RNA polymerase sigma-70 factor (ECF subfamily)
LIDDFVLIERWREGEKAAGQELLQRHFDAVYSFFENKCEREADELTQATFASCVKSIDRFRKHSTFRTYLFAIARHELLHMLRRRERHDNKLDFDVSSIAELVTTPRTRIARREEHAHLMEAMRRLPVEQQTLLELHYWEDLGISELAEVFDVEAGAIRTRLYRARQALKDALEHRQVPAQALETLETMDDWVRDARVSRDRSP